MHISELAQRLRQFHSATAQAIAVDLHKFEQISSVDPEMALVRARRVVDLISRSLCAAHGMPAGTKPLDQLLGDLSRARLIPALIDKHCRVIKEFGNVAAHGITDLDSAGAPFLTEHEVQLTAMSLAALVQWYIANIAPSNDHDVRFVVYSGHQVTHEMIDEAIAIDRQVYHSEFQGRADACHAWLDRNPEIYTIIVDSGSQQVVGYINAMPVERELFELIATGTKIDVDIPSEKILRFSLPDFYLMYFSSIALHPSYASTTAFKALFDAFIDKLLRLARQDVFVTEIIADAVTPDGVKLCEFAGMKRCNDSNHGSSIYKVSLIPPSLRVTTSAGKSLLLFYQQKYEEFRGLLI